MADVYEDNRVLGFLLSQIDVLNDVVMDTIESYTFQDLFLSAGEILELSGTFKKRDLVIVCKNKVYKFPEVLKALILLTEDFEKFYDCATQYIEVLLNS